MKFICSIFYALVFTTFVSTVGLANSAIDSLQQELLKEMDDPARIDILNELSEQLARTNMTESRRLAKEAYDLSIKTEWIPGQAKALVRMALVDAMTGQLEDGIAFSEQAIALARTNSLPEVLADAYHAKALGHHIKGSYSDALVFYHEAMLINEDLERFNQLLPQLNNIALVYREFKDYEMALEYLQRQGEVARKLKDEKAIRIGVSNIGYVLLDQKAYDKAYPYIQDAINLALAANDSLSYAIGLNLLAEIYLGLADPKQAEQQANSALNVCEILTYEVGLIHGNYTLAKLYLDQGNIPKALAYGKAAMQWIDTSMSTRHVEGVLEILVEGYKAEGQLDQALLFQDQLLRVKEKIFAKDNEMSGFRLETDYQLREKEKQNEALKTELELGARVIRQQRLLSWAVSLIGVLGLGLCVVLYRSLRYRTAQKVALELAVEQRTRELQENNEKLLLANKELERFAYVASHDLKEPLRSIMSFAQLVDRELEPASTIKEYTQFIISSAGQLYYLIENILEFSKLYDEEEKGFEKVDLNEVVAKVRIALSQVLTDKNVQLSIGALPQIQGKPALLFMVFKNLVENGIKFNRSTTPEISIGSEKTRDGWKVWVRDNGIGISPEYHESIFEMFKRLHTKSDFRGAGLGLAITQKIIGHHQASIEVTSAEQKGSTFVIKFKAR